MIDGRLDYHLLVLLREDVDDKADALHDAGDEAHPLLLHLPLMVVGYPSADGRPEVARHDGVTE